MNRYLHRSCEDSDNDYTPAVNEILAQDVTEVDEDEE